MNKLVEFNISCDITEIQNDYTVKLRSTVPRVTGSVYNIPGPNYIPQNQASCVSQCRLYPD